MEQAGFELTEILPASVPLCLFPMLRIKGMSHHTAPVTCDSSVSFLSPAKNSAGVVSATPMA